MFSPIGGIIGGGSAKKASQKAMEAQTAALNRGIDTQNAFLAQTRSDYQPYTTAGTQALGGLSDLLGLAGPSGTAGPGTAAPSAGTPVDRQRAAIEALRTGPLYNSLYGNGLEAILQSASATGGLRGGNTERGLADFGSDTLARVYDDAYSKLSGLAGLGVGAQGTVTQAGGNVTNNVTDLLGNIGKAQATNYLTKGGINAQNWSNAGSFLDDAVASALPGGSMLSQLFGSKPATAGQVAAAYPAAQAVARANPSYF